MIWYKNFILKDTNIHVWHDDHVGEGIEVIEFPYLNLLGDFRVFNGLSLQAVDDWLSQLREIFVQIQQNHAYIEAAEKLSKTD